MTGFYHHLSTVPLKAEALQKIQIAMLRGQIEVKSNHILGAAPEGIALPDELQMLGDRSFIHPYYWAGFTLVGNPW